MTPTLRSLHTLVPDTVLIQDDVRDVFVAQPEVTRLAQRLITTAFDSSGIETRHSAVAELTHEGAGDDEPVFFDAATGQLLLPGTRTRNEVYTAQAATLFVEAARGAIDATPDITAADITHIVTVSCTGFFAPGPDYVIARDLGMRAGVQRYHLGFMGCYAAIPALRVASQFCEADPDAVVLVVSVELCTLHLRSSTDVDTIVAASLFADGAAAAIMTGAPPAPGERALTIERFGAAITPVGEGDMAWTIGDHGFDMVLSTYVPHIIDENIVDALRPLTSADTDLEAALETGAVGDAIEHWAIHPGGRSILDKVEERLRLRTDQLAPARDVLRRYGNMSSATVMFVLQSILEGTTGVDALDGDRVLALAFGPGLTVESGLFTVTTGA